MDSSDFHIKMKNGARRFCFHRIRVPLPLFILKIVLIIALIVISVLALVHTFILDKILAWKPPPIILVPGLMSSKLYVEGNGIKYPDEFSKECSQNIQFRKSWMSGHLKNEPNCELFLLSLRHEGGKFFDQPNVRITPNLRGIPFGSSLWPVQCIFSDEKPFECDISTMRGEDDSYFCPLAEFLMAKMKYQEGKTLFAAQYDWRHHQKSVVMDKYYEDLQFLVEHTVNMTKKKAILFGHSMGNIVINRFLREKVDAEWQKEYLQTTINVAAPYGGATKAILSLISGETMLNGSITPNQAVNFVHQMASIANLLPFKNAFGNETLVKIGPKEYSATKMADFMEAVGIGHLIKFYEENEPIPQEHTPMHCIYSVGQNNTDYKYEYSSTSGEAPKRIEMGEGDGTVNAESLRICKEWKEMGHSVEVKEFVDMKHTEILMKREFFEYIANLLKTL